ncbi:MAG: metal-dependent phosphohydrolase [Deltaproteobacteria bacterium]|nr:metal-dependent phosphohydrolase [Deltaproteobacteria bacterium]
MHPTESGIPSIMTRSGRFIRFDDPDPDTIDIGDIAHGLSHLCRFAGHTREFYSVAEHSVYVANLCPPELQLRGLLHDAAEAYVVDLPKPLKRIIPEYREIERKVMAAVCQRFGLPEEEPATVKRADLIMLVTEARDLCGPGWEEWGIRQAPLPERLAQPLHPELARTLFLEKFRSLAGSGTPVVRPPFGRMDEEAMR